MPDESTLDSKPETAVNPQPAIAIGRLELSDERAELSDERPVFGALHYFEPAALKAAMEGRLLPAPAAKTEEVEADHE